MADTGCDARRMFEFFEYKQWRWLLRHRTSPVTSNIFLFVLSIAALCVVRWRAIILDTFIRSRTRSSMWHVVQRRIASRWHRVGQRFNRFARKTGSRDLGDRIQSNAERSTSKAQMFSWFQELPLRPQWGHSSATREGVYLPPFHGWRRGYRVCPFLLKKRWPGGRGGSACREDRCLCFQC